MPVGYGHVRTATQLPVLTMVTGYSRWASAVLVPSRRAEDLFCGWWQLIEQLEAVPRVPVWDGETAVGRWRHRQPQLTGECQAFRGTLAAKVLICKPKDPEAKGLVERLHDYLETPFLPGRTFVSPADFNRQLGEFLARANRRWHRTLGCRLVERIDADRLRCCRCPRCRRGRLAVFDPAAARSLHSSRQQRPLGAPGGDRPPHRHQRRSRPDPRLLRRHARRRPRTSLGAAPNRARPGSSRRGKGAAP